MARKPESELVKAQRALSPSKPVKPEEPAPTPAQRARVAAMLQEAREKILAHPKPKPLEHWKRVLANPDSCHLARTMAKEAIAELERRGPIEDRIRIEAEMQETARRITKQMTEEKTG